MDASADFQADHNGKRNENKPDSVDGKWSRPAPPGVTDFGQWRGGMGEAGREDKIRTRTL
jgi:hypothetical protein